MRIAFVLRLIGLLGGVGRIVWFVRIVKIVDGDVFVRVFGHGVLQGERGGSRGVVKRGRRSARQGRRPGL